MQRITSPAKLQPLIGASTSVNAAEHDLRGQGLQLARTAD
jgi:hypothetical protein